MNESTDEILKQILNELIHFKLRHYPRFNFLVYLHSLIYFVELSKKGEC